MADASSPASRAVRVALVTCAGVPDLDPDDRLVVDPLEALGVGVDAVVWDDAGVTWGAYDLVVLRSPWDYTARQAEFVAWARTVPRLANPADVVAWNTDKRYLGELADDGVPVVPTQWVWAGDLWTLPTEGEWVIKPAIGAGSMDAGRYDGAVFTHRALATSHVRRLQGAGKLVMIQPYLSSVDSYGETSLLYFGGEYSHAIRKGPMLDGPSPSDDSSSDELYKPEEITAREPSPAERAVADHALAVVPGGRSRLLYARVDLIPGRDGKPLVVEVELTEPSLFLDKATGAPDTWARAIATAARA